MATYQETEDGALENNGTVVPPGNYLYAQILDEVARGVWITLGKGLKAQGHLLDKI